MPEQFLSPESHNGFTDLEITIQTGRPPLPKRIEYYIYTLERIQI